MRIFKLGLMVMCAALWFDSANGDIQQCLYLDADIRGMQHVIVLRFMVLQYVRLTMLVVPSLAMPPVIQAH